MWLAVHFYWIVLVLQKQLSLLERKGLWVFKAPKCHTIWFKPFLLTDEGTRQVRGRHTVRVSGSGAELPPTPTASGGTEQAP